MPGSEAIDRFVTLSESVIADLRKAIHEYGPHSTEYPNAEIALKNVLRWHELAMSGNLAGAYSPNFGISRSDLMFGSVEKRLYELEAIYVNEINK